MSLERPGFKPNLKANLASTEAKKLFIKIPAGSSMLFRFYHPASLDPVTGEPISIFYHVAKHYGLLDEDGGGFTCADLAVHGTPETGRDDYIAKVSTVLMEHNKKKSPLWVIGDKISTSHGYNAAVEVAEKHDTKFAYRGPMILGLPPTGARAVLSVEQAADMAGEASPFDPDKGFNIMITNHGKQPWYEAQRAGNPVSLDVIKPGWADTYITDLPAKVNVRVLSYEEQRAVLQRTYANEIDWDMMQSEYGL